MKVQKAYQLFTESVEGLSLQDLEKNLLLYAGHREDTLMAQKNDEQLQEAKQKATEFNAPYTDSLKTLKMKLAYLNILIHEMKE